jgi:hypothetical protein
MSLVGHQKPPQTLGNMLEYFERSGFFRLSNLPNSVSGKRYAHDQHIFDSIILENLADLVCQFHDVFAHLWCVFHKPKTPYEMTVSNGESFSIRRFAMATYSALSSISTASRRSRSATKPTVPAPPNGSKTVQGITARGGRHQQVGSHPKVARCFIPSKMRRFTSLAFCTPAASWPFIDWPL